MRYLSYLALISSLVCGKAGAQDNPNSFVSPRPSVNGSSVVDQLLGETTRYSSTIEEATSASRRTLPPSFTTGTANDWSDPDELKTNFSPLIGTAFSQFQDEFLDLSCFKPVHTIVNLGQISTQYTITHISSLKDVEQSLEIDSTTRLGFGAWKASLAEEFASSDKVSTFY